MASNMFFKFAKVGKDVQPNNKTLVGESRDDLHENSIDLTSWNWGAESNINIGSGSSGASAGKARFKELTLTKRMDSSSTGIMSLLLTGDLVEDATLSIRAPYGDRRVYLTIELKQVVVGDVSFGGYEEQEQLTETVVLQFGGFKMQYVPVDERGKAKSPTEVMWSQVKNSAEF